MVLSSQLTLHLMSRSNQIGNRTLIGTVLGVLIGFGLIFFSPVVLWNAETQHAAKDLLSAEQLEADVVESGYVTFQGPVSVDEAFLCGEDNVDCLQYSLDMQELVPVEREECGVLTEGVEVLYETELKCDEEQSCKQCYMVEVQEWQTYDSENGAKTVDVGSYEVAFNNSALMLGTVNETVTLSETFRDVWSYFPLPDELRVAGISSDGKVSGAGEQTYVLSPYGFDQTLVELQEKDASMKWILRVVTFVMIAFGVMGILGPLRYMGHILRHIPLLGGLLDEASGLIVGLTGLLLAIPLFAIFWTLVTVLKFLWLILAVVALGGIGFGLYLWKGKEEEGKKPSRKKKK
jgi:hypothetical protein